MIIFTPIFANISTIWREGESTVSTIRREGGRGKLGGRKRKEGGNERVKEVGKAGRE